MTQRSLTALRIGNFKAFADTQRIPLKPITLIFGPNSAGKSSIVHGLAFAHEAAKDEQLRGRAPLDVYRTALGGNAIDLGGFAQFVHGHDTAKTVEWGAEVVLPGFGWSNEHKPVTVAVSVSIGIPSGSGTRGSVPRVTRLELTVDGAFLLAASYRRMTSRDFAVLRVDRFDRSHARIKPLFHYACETSNNDPKLYATKDLEVDFDAELVRSVVFAHDPLSFELAGPVDEARDDKPEYGTTEHPDSSARELLWHEVRALVTATVAALQKNFERMEYLGPIRSLPPRNFSPGDFSDAEWNAGGGRGWEMVSRDAAVRDAVNSWLAKPELKTPYRLEVHNLVAVDDVEGEVAAALYKHNLGHRPEPMTPLERRELLTKDLAEVYAELNERYEADRALSEESSKLVAPWIKRLAKTHSPDERERLLAEADAALDRWQEEVLARTPPSSDEELAHDVINADWDDDNAAIGAASIIGRIKSNDAIRKQQQLVLHDINKNIDVSHRDVGTGISQVLPVLVAAYGSQNRAVLIEQPEIHLHPALQAELGDAFIESALGERQNTFILETHSEHLILRIMKRMRQTWQKKQIGLPPITPADVAILYVEPDGKRSIVREMPLNEAGELVKAWPHGFFEEGLAERFDDA